MLAALERAKQLPCGQTLTSRPMSKLIGVNWVTLRKWCQEFEGFAESGVVELGARGTEYTFEPRGTILWLVRHFEVERDRMADKTRRISEVLGSDQGAAEGLSLYELKQALDVSLRVRDRQIQDGSLTPVPALKTQLSQVFSEMQQAGARSIQEMDPSGTWPPETREIAENVGRTILLKQQTAAAGLLRGLNGSAAQP